VNWPTNANNTYLQEGAETVCNIIHSKNEFVNHTSAQPYPTTKTSETAPANYYSILANEYDDDDNDKMEAPFNEKYIIKITAC
jgi:hypothetical protein